jgi:opacity protein-like surface antigen
MMKYAALFVSLVLSLLLLAAPAQAQISLTPYAGYNTASGYSFDFDEEFDDDDSEGEFSVQGSPLVGLGAEVALPFSDSFDLKFRPSAEVAFPSGNEYSEDDDRTVTTSHRHLKVSGDVIAEFGSAGSTITPYAGAGLTYALYAYQIGTEETFDGETNLGYASIVGSAVGLNVLGGVRFPGVVDFGEPFAQLRATAGPPTPTGFGGDGDDVEDEPVDDAPEMGTPITLMVGVSFDL